MQQKLKKQEIQEVATIGRGRYINVIIGNYITSFELK